MAAVLGIDAWNSDGCSHFEGMTYLAEPNHVLPLRNCSGQKCDIARKRWFKVKGAVDLARARGSSLDPEVKGTLNLLPPLLLQLFTSPQSCLHNELSNSLFHDPHTDALQLHPTPTTALLEDDGYRPKV